MINPNAKHSSKGVVTELTRWNDGRIRSLEVTLDSGRKLNELGFLEHKTIKIGERVSVVVGFRITSDRYGIESIRRTKVGA